MKKLNVKPLMVGSIAASVIAGSIFQVNAQGVTSKDVNPEQSSVDVKASIKGEHTITLITGDVVKVSTLNNGKQIINVEPAEKNGEGVRVMTIKDETFVFPNSAMPYMSAGKLDEDLFNITKLIEYGYDDKNTDAVPVIVEYEETKAKSINAAPKGSKKVRELESIQGAALSAEKKQAEVFWNDLTVQSAEKQATSEFEKGVDKIWLDGRVEAALDQSVPQIGADEAWEQGYTGEGVKVAVLDTGIDSQHPDITGQLDEAVSFVPGEEVKDVHGHGTHVASTVLGTGAGDGKHKGVAPDARLLVGKVLSDEGYGQDSWIIDGMEWASEHAKIVNMSLSSDMPSDGTDPMSEAVNQLTEENGTLFVIAAGNRGGEGTIGSPGAADSALTVGAVDKSDELAYFSSKGPRYGDMGLKPDLSAPGVDIVAARSHYSNGDGLYKSMSGTSMATPHVVGAAAILAEKHPEWDGETLKQALMNTTKKLDGYQPYHVGTGRVDIPAALGAEVRVTESVSFGFFKWPHDGAEPVEKVVTYTNEGKEEVTLELDATFTNAEGNEAPAGMLTLSQESVTVPAGGKVDVNVTLDSTLGETGSRYQGFLTAKADGKELVRTTMAMVKEEERYPLTLNATDRDGEKGLAYVVLFSEKMEPEVVAVDGSLELRLPPGTYSAMSLMDVDADTDDMGVALVGDPEVKLDGPKTVELDARKAKEIKAVVPKKAEANYKRLEYHQTIGEMPMTSLYLMPVWIDKLYAVPTKEVKSGYFEQLTRWRLTKPTLTIDFKGKELDDIPLAGSTLLDGKYNLSTVYAGKGSAADFDRLKAKGKAVVVDRNAEVSVSQQATNAAAAEAKLLIVVNSEDKEFSVYAGTADYTDNPVAVAGISKSEGDKLVKAVRSGNVKLKVEGTVDSPYLYDLMDVHEGSIPKNLTYAPKGKELAKIETNYTSPVETDGGEFRYDLRPHTMGAVGFLQKVSLPSARTEYVSAIDGTGWYHQANVLDETWQVRQPLMTYDGGEKIFENWFSPVVRPSLGDGYWPPRRQGNSLQINVPAWADGGKGNTGGTDWDISNQNQTTQLYMGDTLLKEGKGQALNVWDILPQERTQYRFVTDAKRDENRWKTSTRTHTEWTFWTEETENWMEDLPFLILDYKVDTDVNGDALLNRPTELKLSVDKVEGAIGYGDVKDAALEVSFNEGKSWKKVKLDRDGDTFKAIINNPKNAKNVSLKASAWDDQGNKISQEIIKAYGLR
ncbi:S8 family peptidase [Rossellomorea vietnamensis]|uniref:S8 family peptidase n=1 Tax=Rossellomorea vietnamensis TaxID=218284 RepID=UPI00077C630A|nr:S8 family serine peptidase [Rossellomorea vietnamensis]OXS63791.1 peptidase [Bacillus sp. DSM 27956]PRX78862.1 PA domain-containing protein [Bacillus sp. V-88]SLK14253.1 PA domain-containing protein [Bacillus sp. V-88]